MESGMIKTVTAVFLIITFLMPPQTAAAISGSADRCGEKHVTLVAAGDNLIHSSIFKDARTGDGYDFAYIYEPVADIISGADIAYINQETPLGYGDFSGYPRFCSPSQVGEALVRTGFDIIGVANNHMLDRGDEGLKRTKDILLSAGASDVIGYDSDHIAIVEKNGIRLSFVAFTYSSNCDGMSDIPRLSEARVRRLIGKAKEQSDVVVCAVHFGDEFDSGRYVGKYALSENQVFYSGLMAECGADIILGTHPRVLEEVRLIPRTDGGTTVCAYSLGNFLSNMRYGAQMLGGILKVDIRLAHGKATVGNVCVIPTVCHFNGMHRGYRIYPLSSYSDELAASHGTGDEKNEKRFCMETLTCYYENNINAEFRVK